MHKQRCTLCGSGSGVEHHLAKVRVAGSNLVFRSTTVLNGLFFFYGSGSGDHRLAKTVAVNLVFRSTNSLYRLFFLLCTKFFFNIITTVAL